MADGMDKGLMALMGIEDDSSNLRSASNLSCNTSGYSVSQMSDIDEDSLEQFSTVASPQGLVSTSSGRHPLNLSDAPKSPISRTLHAGSSSLFIRTSSPVDNSSEWHSISGMPQKRKPSQRSKSKTGEPGGFMFSPTLKPKKIISKPHMLHPIEITHQNTAPTRCDPARPLSPLSISPPLFPDDLSDMQRSSSSLFDMESYSKSFSDDEGLPYLSCGKTSVTSFLSDGVFTSTSTVGDHEWDRDSDRETQGPSMTLPKPVRLSKKQDLQETKERERLLRIGSTNLKSTVNKKLTLQYLMKQTLTKQQPKEGKSRSKPDSISLSSSEDEVEMEAEQETEQWRLGTLSTFLEMRLPKASSPRGQVLGAKEPASIIVSPLSNQIQNLSLLGSSSQGVSDLVFTTTPMATYSSKRGAASRINDFKSQMKREVSKRNFQHRSIPNNDTDNSAKRRSLDDQSVEYLSKERRKIRGPIDEDEVGIATSSLAKDNEGLDLEHEFDEEKNADTESDNGCLPGESEGYDMQTESEASANEMCDSDQDNGDTQPVKIKRAMGRNSNVIGDDDSDLRVVLIDHSQARSPSKSENKVASDSCGSVHGPTDYHNRNSNDDDISDLDQPAYHVKEPHSVFRSNSAQKSKAPPTEDTGTCSTTLSPPTDTDAVGLYQASEKEADVVLSGAIDFLSGRFPLARSSSDGMILVRQPTINKLSPFVPSSSFIQAEALNAHDINQESDGNGNIVQSIVDTGNQEHGRGRRLIKPDPKNVISKSNKSAFIEYEAEEEEDEFMGMGGIDYESDNSENDDYDLGDDMIDGDTKLGSRDAENVRKLHMQHEQDQHNKDISDLVHGIAAGSLWKRRNGQVVDLDLFDVEDMEGRFRRKKKLKISEKLEELADNPTTFAFARAFTKNVDDDRLVFLSDVDETDSERETHQESNATSMRVSSLPEDQEDEDVEEEALSTDRRRERLREGRLPKDKSIDCSEWKGIAPGSLTTVTRAQVLPFGIMAGSPYAEPIPQAVGEFTDPLDDLKQVLRRKRVIRNIMDDADDPLMAVEFNNTQSPPVRLESSSFNLKSHLPVEDASFLDGSRTTLLESASIASNSQDAASETSVNMTAIAKPEKLVHQSSIFLPEDRKSHFLRTVGDESRQSTRVVKDMNRRRMAFAPSTSSGSAEIL